MNRTKITLNQMAEECCPQIKEEIRLSMEISNRLDDLMRRNGISKTDLAKSLGKHTSEVSGWLSGQHNFSLRTIASLSSFFQSPLIEIPIKGSI